jgi:glycosyltransferase involved in cell wall biosynthesis
MERYIWVISELYYPEETSTGYFMTGIAEGLARYFKVKVLCSQPTYSKRGVRAPSNEQRHGVSIKRCFGTTLNKDVLVFRLINMTAFSMAIFFNVWLRIKKEDTVLVVTNPPVLSFGINLICMLRGSKCILLIHDVYPEVLVAAGMVASNSLVTRISKWLTHWLYLRVTRIIALGRDMSELIKRKIGQTKHNVIIIPNWGDTDLIRPSGKRANLLLEKLQLKKQFVVQYAGNLGRTHGLEHIAISIQKLADREDIHFLFIGSGAKKKWLQEFVKSKRLKNVTILEPCPRVDLSQYLNACDISVISFVPGMAGISVPSRMYNVMAAGKPIVAVADESSELALVVKEEKIGWVVPPDKPDLLVSTILEARATPERLEEMGFRSRRAAERRFTIGHVTNAYKALVDEISCEPT